MTGHCRDCGETLDRFGICPFADPELARLAHAPVHCGKTPQRNAAEVAVILDSAMAVKQG